ncbi:MAG: CoA synthetase, partial [Rhodospirillaceae bacterium]|nr:CoA synthetase [Rhodospirillaceae bacterium]
MAEYALEELLIATVADLLQGCGHIAVGVSSPIPGSAALLRRHRDREAGKRSRVSIIGTTIPAFRTDGGVDLFDSAGQG